MYKLYGFVFILFVHLDIVLSDPSVASVPIISPGEQQKKHLQFSGVLRGCRVGAVARNGSVTDRARVI